VSDDTKFKFPDYKGDRNISYLKSPDLFGTDGFKVVMPTFRKKLSMENGKLVGIF
jgi:hypothetical protein